MSEHSLNRWIVFALLAALAVDLAARLGIRDAHAQTPEVRCEVAEWKGLVPGKSKTELMATLTTLIGGSSGHALAIPITIQGSNESTVICAW